MVHWIRPHWYARVNENWIRITHMNIFTTLNWKQKPGYTNEQKSTAYKNMKKNKIKIEQWIIIVGCLCPPLPCTAKTQNYH